MGKRGLKTCEKCGLENGVRAYYCKECEQPFKMKKRSKSRKGIPVRDWTTLRKGDYIRVVGRSGNYYTRENGERIYFTDAGIYHIKYIHLKSNGDSADGLTVIGTGRQRKGFEYLYMGPVKPSDILDSITNAPHKLYKVDYIERPS